MTTAYHPQANGTRHVMTTAYHPQANGLVERTHRQRAREAGSDWPAHLPWVLLGLRAAPKEVSGFSSAEAVFGQPLVLPGELVQQMRLLQRICETNWPRPTPQFCASLARMPRSRLVLQTFPCRRPS
jgi:hypothetical protein